jgi:hypothetical protein
MDQDKEFLPWKLKNIRENSFFPKKLLNIGGDGKVVFVLIGINGILTFAVKTSRWNEEKYDDGFYFNLNDTFEAVVLSRLRTFAVTDKGSIYDFSSYKKIQLIRHLAPVQVFGYFENKYVSLSCQNSDVIIRVYLNDFPDKQVPYKTFELKGENDVVAIESEREQDKFQVNYKSVTNSNLNFFKNVVAFGDEILEGSQIVLFSVTNKLILLHFEEESDEFNVEVVGTFLSKVEDFEFFEVSGNQILLVLIENSTLCYYRFDSIMQTVGRQEIFLSGEIVSFNFIKSHNTFIYSNENEFVEVKFKSDGSFEEMVKKIPGIQAVTFVESLDSLVAIDLNKMFFQIKLTNFETSSSINDFFELDDSALATFDQLSWKIFEETKRRKILEEKFNKLLKSYRNLENFESNLNGISFSTKISETLGNLKFIKEKLVLLEINGSNITVEIDDLKISIEYRDPKSKCSIKKIQKLCDSEFETKLMENLNFVETNFMVKIRLFRELNSECIKFYNLPKK